jgi:cell division protein FtsB
LKKFLIIMISLLILFTFLMLNYLLWDKENLMEQRENDKIQQDWLRGQNRTLQSTVEELEQTVNSLENENKNLSNRVSYLEEQLRQANMQIKKNQEEIEKRNEALYDFKTLFREDIETVLENWLDSVNSNKYDQSTEYIDSRTRLWGKYYETEQYLEHIKLIQAITLTEHNDQESFIILNKDTEPYEVQAEVHAKVSLDDSGKNLFGNLKNGNNILIFTFKYDPESSKWVIREIMSI